MQYKDEPSVLRYGIGEVSEVDQQSEHLSDAQVEQYGNTVSAAEPEAGDGDQVETHLADCPACRNRVLASQRARLALLADLTVNTTPLADHPGPGPDCSGEDALRNLAAGLCPPNLAAKLMQHAAQCDHCGPLLRMYTEGFSDDLSAEDQAVLGRLKSSSAGWQKGLAGRMLAGSDVSSSDVSSAEAAKKPFPWRWVLTPTALAACAAIAFAVWYQQRVTPEKVEKLLAQAYTEQRTMEMRFPGAAWGPMRVTRGPEDTRFSRPAPLLEAEGIIGRKQLAYPDRVDWLRAKAEADILDRNPGSAIDSLERALEAQPESLPLLLDLSIAYSQQGEITKNAVNYEKAIDVLAKILQKDPGNQAALFNHALLSQQLMMIDSAIADWEALLRTEKDPGWLDEARNKLEALKELKRRRSATVVPSSPEQWRAALNSNGATVAEEALATAVLEWLPKAYPAHALHDQTESQYASLLSIASTRLQSEHGDDWLLDLLRLGSSSHFAQGVYELRAASLLNAEGKASDAIDSARKAGALFRQDQNHAGLARAQLEEVYGYQRSGRGVGCLDTAFRVRTGLQNRAYLWLATQLLLDEASCFNMLGRLDEAKLDVDDALVQNDGTAAYKVLRLRALGIAAGLATTRGDRSFAVNQDVAGLQEYWSGDYPVQRAYQFYSDLSFNAEAQNLWHISYTSAMEAVSAIAQTPNKQVEAIARFRLAKAAVMLDARQVAQAEMRRANQIFEELPKNESTLIAQIDGIAGVIRSYITLGQYSVALDQLNRIMVPPEFTESRLIARRIDQIRGDIELKLGHLKEAQEAHFAAVSIAESSLSTLHDDHSRLIWSHENESSYRALTSMAIKQNEPATALDIWESYRAAPIRFPKSTGLSSKGSRFVVARFGRRSIVRTMQPQLREQTRIVYTFLAEGLAMWVVDDTEIEFSFASMNLAEIHRLARQFTDECSNPRSDLKGLRSNGTRLYKALLGPFSRRLKPEKVLVFETDGELDRLPFAALVDDSGKYLGESFGIVFSPGLAYRQHLRRPEFIRRADRALVVGDPEIGGKWSRILPPLPTARAEAEAVSARFDHPMLLVGSDASNSNLQRQLRSAQVFQFAGHSIETNSGIAFVVAVPPNASDGTDLLILSESSTTLMRHLQLAVLSACDTAKGQANSPGAIARPFLMAGVPRIIVSNWRIDSAVSAEFMDSFYEQLISRKQVPEALRRAAQTVGLHWVHPYYWAAFIEVGEA